MILVAAVVVVATLAMALLIHFDAVDDDFGCAPMAVHVRSVFAEV